MHSPALSDINEAESSYDISMNQTYNNGQIVDPSTYFVEGSNEKNIESNDFRCNEENENVDPRYYQKYQIEISKQTSIFPFEPQIFT